MTDLSIPSFKSGYVMILGLPNVGKSTLLNRLVSEKIAIVTPKPQTTRNRILGIANGENHQVLFLDTPGVCKATNQLNKYLLAEIDRSFADADLICFMTEASRPPKNRELDLLKRLNNFSGPVFLLINKIDRIVKHEVLPLIETYNALARFDHILPISATDGENCAELFEQVVKFLPFGPPYYPDGDLTNITERFLAAETVREQVFLLTRQEIPYSTAVLVTSFKDEPKILRITAEVVVERSTQKGIIIGKGGSMLKQIGSAARQELEKFYGKQVYLELFVKISENWSNDPAKLKELGYK